MFAINYLKKNLGCTSHDVVNTRRYCNIRLKVFNFSAFSDFFRHNRNQFSGSRHLETFAPNLSFNKTESETNGHWRTFAVTERTAEFGFYLSVFINNFVKLFSQ